MLVEDHGQTFQLLNDKATRVDHTLVEDHGQTFQILNDKATRV
jgi:hypothetical protein